MNSVQKDTTIKLFQDFIFNVYGLPNDRHFYLWDMAINMERFIMRALKGVRKNDPEKTKSNLLIALSWFMSIMNQLHINVEDKVWERFPHLCLYCGTCPCSCVQQKAEQRKQITPNDNQRPKTLAEFQKMFNDIYPAGQRTLEHASVHLAEEVGEFSEAIMGYRGEHQEKDFNKIEQEAADLLSCFIGVFNSLGINLADELAVMYENNCHICKQAPCVCDFSDIINFKS